MTRTPSRIRVWDLPTRMFHWSLAVLVVFSFTTGKVGGDWMAWHLKSGYAILALVLFRLAWGFAGSESARFASFLRGPRTALLYARETLAGRHPVLPGHNPLGGWMVVVLLAALAFQVTTGLFSDDEIATQGPLAVKVSNDTVSRMSGLHHWGQWVMVALVALHVVAIALYRWRWNARLVGPMVHGWFEGNAGTRAPAFVPAWRALVLIALAAALVYGLVAIVPMR